MHTETEGDVLYRVEHTRARLGQTIEQIGERVNPDRVQRELEARARAQVQGFKDEVKTKARRKMRGIEYEVNEAGRGVWETIRENPLPAGLVGFGLAWMLANRGATRSAGTHRLSEGESSREWRRDEPSFASTGAMQPPLQPPLPGTEASAHRWQERERVGDQGGGRDRESVRDRAEEMASELRERAEGAVASAQSSAQDWGGKLAEGASERWNHAHRAVSRGARRAEHRAEDVVRENPLAAGLVATAIGFAAGLLIPETDRERELMGPASGRAMSHAKGALLEARDAAVDVAREAMDEVVDQSGDPKTGGPRDRGEDPVSSPGR